VFEHILLATDLSESSEGAFRIATVLAREHSTRLTLLYVYEVSARTLAGISEAEAARTWPGPVRARSELDAVVAGLRATGLRADGVVRFGVVAPGGVARRIAEVASEERVDLVVTGTAGRSGLARLWYGSVAEQVLRSSSTPVLAVPMLSARVIGFASRPPRRGRRSAMVLTSTSLDPRTRSRGAP
jgi:nucleotide-binding universal stress UspA family protein